MEKFIIEGGGKLQGAARIKAAKNAVLPQLAAALLTDEKVVLKDCPDISDIHNMLSILRLLGATAERTGETVTVSGGIKNTEIPSSSAKEIRSSVFLLGPILARLKKAKVAYPGGCDIGLRPIDIHIKGLRELNILVEEENGYIFCDASNARAADIVFDKISVGATENLMMCSVFIKGRTVLRNAAREPEIVDLALLLNKMGAKIRGAGGSVIEIIGVDGLKGAEHTPIPDRIVAGTLLLAGAMCGCDMRLDNVIPEHIFSLTSKLPKNSCTIKHSYDIIKLNSRGRRSAFDITTMPYPGYPTDLQAQTMAYAASAAGTGVITETVFETRFRQAAELIKMGADITVRGNTAIVRGVDSLCGAEVTAHDLRGGAALVIAGLAAKGVTEVSEVAHVDRGYERLEDVLNSLGGKIIRKHL